MARKKLTYIISNINKALAFEWLANAEQLHAHAEVHFLLLNPEPGYLFSFLREKGIPVQHIRYRGKKDMPVAIVTIYRYLSRHAIDIVHTHLFDANLAGLFAAWLAGVPKRIHTRHHSTLHHIYFPRAVYYDRFINRLSTHIIAISQMVAAVLVNKEAVPVQKVVLIQHGFQLKQFSEVASERVEEVAQRHGIPQQAFPKIGLVARYTHWKGIQYVIPAFKALLKQYPQAQLILANAHGDYQQQIKNLLKELPAGAFKEIVFEADIPALYKLMDVYVHVPIDDHSEAFGQTYVEALAAGVPAVFTLSGVAPEFVADGEHALLVPYKNEKAIEKAVKHLLENKDLRQKLIANGQAAVRPMFEFDAMIEKLIRLYQA